MILNIELCGLMIEILMCECKNFSKLGRIDNGSFCFLLLTIRIVIIFNFFG